ncbi:carbon storage regulator [Roseiconus lacunae]|uniref:Translational regulator CsrA n=1 Tax=Roseiconus lacunae TaxID=2605694 RepID=A0ABT7PKP2_9BACT|nr:carbon storage regulator [Roseiconus lacunae]MCD0460719.1 carbon storage regulator [Roseiconus lacunae]MDM4017072.1 carbon storage regulator [Roseiconus lacunae]WRQ51346.1 carbon storage regulator [Stieleria sp. HD01]
MLVLSRKAGEKLMIGDDVVLTINRISGNRVAIGIEAPKDVRIVRGELNKAELAPAGAAPNTAPMGDARIAVASRAEA